MMAFGAKKLDEVYGFMDVKNLDGFFFHHSRNCRDVNLRYFTGFEGEGCFLLSKSTNILFAHPLQLKNVKRTNVDEIAKMETRLIKSKLKGMRRIGVVGDVFPLSLSNLLRRQKIKLVDVKNFFDKLRSVKLAGEVRIIERNCRYTNQLLRKLRDFVRAGTSEMDVRKFILKFIVDKNLSPAFRPIIAFDGRSASPHPIPNCSSKRLRRIGYVDFGTRCRGYNSDVTLPIILESDERVERAVGVVKIASRILEREMRAGRKISEISREVEELYRENGFRIEHALGHGVGLKVHEFPSISSKFKEDLRKNMVLAIEPSIYLKDFGLRLENNFLVLKNRSRKLTVSECLDL